ncbi:MGH1-like glycoside hydrolase domain-containing protein [Inquilinus limosus]|uniref:MGH1-like glycoside hydrolase domain-containing protein n=1 Tax=Inquilinus limosus TaxID=171674 RepID=UPI000412C7B7|nr:trehalase family glycosidase [Inquilinus limosus]
MLRDTTVPLARAWNTWSSRPAEMVFLPLGVRVTPLAYADSSRSATLFPAKSVRYGRHALDGSLVELDLDHAGTLLAWRWAKRGPFALSGTWRTQKTGEWGLRFWFNLCLSAEDGQTVRWDPAGAALVKVGHRFVALASAEPPVQVTGHATVEAVAEDYETHGYFHLGARSEAAPVLVLRFNLEMMRDGGIGVAVADRADLAVERAKALAAEPGEAPSLPSQTGAQAGALDALRDVMAWNTVWDEVNRRPYTSISRNWNLSKFGGFGVWLNDQLYNALLTGYLDQEMARENLAASLASATPEGNLACLLTANDAWVDRTQLPIGSFLLWLIWLRSRSRPMLELAYGTLARNHAWWWRERDPRGRGLVSYGTSDVGEGLYKGTSFGARNESSMDNSPIHDEAAYDPETRTLRCEDVGLNSLLAFDAEVLSWIAAELGDQAAAAAHAETAARTRAKIGAELWDESRGIFANRLWSGEFVRSLGPTSFYPLICGAASPGQIQQLLAHLEDPATFGGEFVIPGTTRDDPAAKDNSYWRGRIWPPLNWMVWHGLRRNGFEAEAIKLAEDSLRLFRRAWDERRLCPENYNAETGEPMDQPDTEGFYSWGALMPALGVARVMDVNPWGGWEVVNDGADATLGPIASPAGAVTVAIEAGVLALRQGSRTLLETNVRGRLSQLRFGEGDIAVTLPPELPAGAWLRFPSLAPERVLDLRIGDEAALWRAEAGVTVDLPPGAAGRTLRVLRTA